MVVMPSYSLNHLLEGRKNKKVYSDFFDHSMLCIAKKKVFEYEVSVTMNDSSTLSTISHEVFGLLLLENSFDHWIDLYRLHKGQVTSATT
jgi:hypothetical protein